MFCRRLFICLTVAVSPALLGPATTALAADEAFAPVKVISLPGGQKIQSFVISFVDPVIGIYILGDRTNQAVDVIDTTTNTVLTQLMGGFVGPSTTGDASATRIAPRANLLKIDRGPLIAGWYGNRSS